MPYLQNVFCIRLCRPQQLAVHGCVGSTAFQLPALLRDQLLIGWSCIVRLSPCRQGVSAQPDEALGSWASDRLIKPTPSLHLSSPGHVAVIKETT
jgi:hypothetical protein